MKKIVGNRKDAEVFSMHGMEMCDLNLKYILAFTQKIYSDSLVIEDTP